MTSNNQFLRHIQNLLDKYESEEKSGIFFKLEKEKDPSEILGVLNFLKYKIEKWGNTNIFSYIGSLFERTTTLVVGSSNSEEAISIIKYVYLSQVLKNNDKLRDLESKFENINEFEEFLGKEISNNMNRGYPTDPKLEKQLKNHMRKMLN